MKVLFIVFIFINTLQAYETKGIFENLGASNIVKEGDAFPAKLTLWPYDATDEKDFYELEGKDFIDFFLVTRVSKVVRSENNSRAVEVFMTLVLKKFFVMNEFYIFEHRDINIPIEIKNINPERRQLKKTEFYIAEQEFVKPKQSKLIYYLLGIAVVLIITGVIYKVKKPKRKKKVENRYKLGVINDRQGFEELYRHRDVLKAEMTERSSEINKLLTQIDNIQYKPEWSNEELNEIKFSYEALIGSRNGEKAEGEKP